MIDTTQLTSFQWIVLGLTSLITLFIYYVQRKQTFWERQGIKGPKPTFLLGNTFSNLSQSVGQLHVQYYKTYGKVFGVYDGLQPHLIVGDADLLRPICVKDFNVFPSGFHLIYKNQIEQNMVSSMFGPEWKRLRSMLSPIFSSGKLKKMFHLMKSCNKNAQKALVQMSTSKSEHFDPKYFWGRYNIDVIASCFFATDLDVYCDQENALLRTFSNLFVSSPLVFLFMALVPEWVTKAFRISVLSGEKLEFLKELMLALIKKRKQKDEKANDALQFMIEFGSTDNNENQAEENKFTPEEIVSTSIGFFIGGYESTSTLLTWATYRLACNPTIQEKLYDEVSKADIEDYSVLSELTYLDAVLNETLRIDPPLTVFQRSAHQDYIIPGTNSLIPKNTQLSIPIYAIHHDPDFYDEPEIFRPERFIDQSSMKPLTFLPFGAGPRTCLGMRFVYINVKLALATFIKNYKVSTTPETPMKPDYIKGSIILAVSQNLKLKIEPRSSCDN